MAEFVTDRRCAACGTAPATSEKPSRRARAKARYCAACRAQRRRRPVSRLTPEQAAHVERLRGTMFRWQIAEAVGVSETQVGRYLRERGLPSNARDYPPEVVAAVLATYAAAPPGRGKQRVQELFPEVHVRSIVERYRDGRARQIRWTPAQLLEAARMAGLVSHGAQARFFGRPNAYGGSIKTLWTKRFLCAPGDLNGMGIHQAWRLARPGCPAVLVRRQEAGVPIAKILWVDLVDWLRPEVEPWVREAVAALARFQRWLHGGATRAAIQQLITEREDEDADDPREWPGGEAGRRAAGRDDDDFQCAHDCADARKPDESSHGA